MAATAAIYARTALGPLQEAIRAAFTLSDNQIALLQGPALALPLVIAAIPLGRGIDRYSRVRVVFVLTVLNLVGSLATALAVNFGILLAARCLIGATGTSTYLVTVSLLSDLYAASQRGRATMIVTLGAVCGMSAAFALGGELLSMSDSGPYGWRRAMLWLSAPLLAVVLLTPAMREPARTGVTMEKPSMRESYRQLKRYRALLVPLVAGLAMVVIADGASTIWAAPTLSRRFALPPERFGAIMSMVLLVSGFLGPLLGGIVADVCQRVGGPRRTISALAVLAFLSIPAAFFPVARDVASVTGLLVAFMTIGVSCNVTVPALITIVIPNELRGLCLTLTSGTCMLSAFGLAPLAVSVLSGPIGGPSKIGTALAIVCVTASAIGAATFMFGRRYLPVRT